MVVQYSLIKELKFSLIKELKFSLVKELKFSLIKELKFSLIKELKFNLIIKYRHSKNAVKTVLLRSGAEINKFLLFCHLWPSYIHDVQKYFFCSFLVSYVKIITDCLTRWNSKSMMINSVIRLREVLEELRDNKCEFANVIPSESQFVLLAEIQPILDSFRKVSEAFSADKHPTIHLACSQLVNLHMKLNSIAQSDIQSATKDFVQILIGELNRRFPNHGTKNHFHAMGNFLHPFFKGALVKKYGDLEGLKAKMVNQHPSHLEFLSQNRNASLNLSGSNFDLDEAEKMALEISGEEVLFRDGKSKIEIELDTYKGLPRPDSSNTDILKWWEAHAKMIPLLSQVARKYLAIPLTSASSERVFSAAGTVVTDARTKLDPKNVDRIVYLKTNIGKMDRAQSAVKIETQEEKMERESKAQEKEKTQSASTGARQNKRHRTNSGSIDLSND